MNHVSATSILLPADTNHKPKSKHNLNPNSDPDHIHYPKANSLPQPIRDNSVAEHSTRRS